MRKLEHIPDDEACIEGAARNRYNAFLGRTSPGVAPCTDKHWNAVKVDQLRDMRVVMASLAEQGWHRDIPELDGTDGAHPAWWRGEEYAAKAWSEHALKILDRKVKAAGNYPGFNEVWRRISSLHQALVNIRAMCIVGDGWDDPQNVTFRRGMIAGLISNGFSGNWPKESAAPSPDSGAEPGDLGPEAIGEKQQ